MDFIAKPFGILMQYLYGFFNSYGVAIIIFTIFVRILLFPLNLKQQKSMLRTQELQPELDELNKRYGNDKQKYNEEQMKLYEKHNINPMAGCFPMLIQLPLILSIYQIVRNPLTHISGLAAESIQKLQEFVATALNLANKSNVVNEIVINNYFFENGGKLAEVSELISTNDIINMQFLGVNLGLNPSLKGVFENPSIYLPLLMIPIISLVSTYIMQKMTTANVQSKSKEGKGKDVANPLSAMTKVMPLITLFITFSVPAGVGLYWITGNLIAIGQNYVTKNVLQKKKEGNE